VIEESWMSVDRRAHVVVVVVVVVAVVNLLYTASSSSSSWHLQIQQRESMVGEE